MKRSQALYLGTEILRDENGKEAASLQKGDIIFIKITDERDIAHYLANLFGIKSSDGKFLSPVQIQEIEKTGDEVRLILYFAPNVFSLQTLSPSEKVKIYELEEGDR